jgi:hypothetical protein
MMNLGLSVSRSLLFGLPNATWVVSENHRAAYAAFREPLARS